MQAGTHSLAGLIAGLQLAAGWHVAAPQALLIAGAAAVGALLPDIDMPASTIGRRAQLVSRPVAAIVRHRGPTHSLIALALVGMTCVHFQPLYGLALALGYASHIAADMLTRNGVRLFWPAQSSIYLLPGLLRVRTGGRIERLLFVALLCLFGLMLWRIAR